MKVSLLFVFFTAVIACHDIGADRTSIPEVEDVKILYFVATSNSDNTQFNVKIAVKNYTDKIQGIKIATEIWYGDQLFDRNSRALTLEKYQTQTPIIQLNGESNSRGYETFRVYIE